MKKNIWYGTILVPMLCMAACTDDEGGNVAMQKVTNVDQCEGAYEEWCSGGKLGTAFNSSTYAYEMPTPVVEADARFMQQFKRGEALFEKEFLTNTQGVRSGLGPVWVRSSCIACHPGYGHGRRMQRYAAKDYGNGYLLVVTNDDDSYVASLTGMPQTQAAQPYLPPIDEAGITIEWLPYEDANHNKFPDGEAYDLIYPEVSIARESFNVPMPASYKVRLEATIGIYGTGLLDAISDDDLLAEYQKQKNDGHTLNDAKYQSSAFIAENDGTRHPGRFTYGLTRGTLQNGPGANAIWNITNVTRSNRRSHYITSAYANAMADNPSILAALSISRDSVYNYLMSQTLQPEMTDADYVDFMVWHRGLAVPAARNLDDAVVQRGRTKFYEIGCIACHKPSWTTSSDDYKGDTLVAGKLPRYPNNKIYPYTDMLQHRLCMKNNIRTGWCRTTPLWGRGLSERCTNAGDHLHDMRARTYTEAIMWHDAGDGTGVASDAHHSVDLYRNLPKADRDAVIKFLESI